MNYSIVDNAHSIMSNNDDQTVPTQIKKLVEILEKKSSVAFIKYENKKLTIRSHTCGGGYRPILYSSSTLRDNQWNQVNIYINDQLEQQIEVVELINFILDNADKNWFNSKNILVKAETLLY